jgi:cell filamentation protein
VSQDPYSDPVTGVPYNWLKLRAAAALEAAEREITHAALILLDESPVSPSYDLPHLREIHRRIFGDIYKWAGQIRTVAIAKTAVFCLPQYVESSAAVIFRELQGEVNALHPFREGNGRAQRAFFRQLARDAGFTLAWQHLDPVRNVEASAATMRGDPEPMRELLRSLIIDAPDHAGSSISREPPWLPSR